MGLLLLSFGLAALLGFAAHRASICTVKAVAEVTGTGKAYLFASIGKSVLWVILITIPFLWFVPAARSSLVGWQFSSMALLGGLVFGMGAAINGACAISTLTRLADGQLRMLTTLGGFVVGAFCYVELLHRGWLHAPLPSPPLVGSLIPWAVALTIGLLLWASYECARLWRTRSSRLRLRELVLATPYRLSSAALVIGLANGALYLIHGPWAYTVTLEQSVEKIFGAHDWPMNERWMLFAAILFGMILSTWHRGGYQIDGRPKLDWLKNIGGGILMGTGAAIVPGGNDALVLYGIPSLSPHAIPAYLAMTIGIALALQMMRLLWGVTPTIECRGDICRGHL